MLAVNKNKVALLSARKEIVLEVQPDKTKSLCLMNGIQDNKFFNNVKNFKFLEQL